MTRRGIFALRALLLALALTGGVRALAADQAVGPMLGHVDDKTARIWLCAGEEAPVRLVVETLAGKSVFDKAQAASRESDFCLTWQVEGLSADTSYRYRLFRGDSPVGDAAGWRFRTAPPPGQRARVALAFGSCASSVDFADVWRRMAIEGAEGVVLLGDTPYIDTSDLAINRQKHRQFLAQPGLSEIIRSRPVWATWDDHDFGKNDSDGASVDRETIRRVFLEYRALRSFGDEGEGIYTSFRRGPVEVFLIDARYFAQTAPSPVDPSKPTLLGRRQWDWLRERLKASDAPFKILVSGMVWHNKPNQEKDKWETYAHERDALFAFLGQERISGALLMGGDIHASCLLRHSPDKGPGYPLFEIVTSPLHDRLIPALIPKSDRRLIWGEARPNLFTRIVADNTVQPARLTATWIQMDGTRVYEHSLTAEELSAAAE